MPDSPSSQAVTRLLRRVHEGDRQALGDLLPLIYDELHALARRQRRRRGGSETLNTTALVHEAYLKLVRSEDARWQDRSHFFRVAATAMRQILVDYALRRRAAKRGGGARSLSLDEAFFLPEEKAEEVIALDEALARLAAFDERQSHLVELRYFVGFTIPETAEALGVSASTVKREWTVARAWLHREIGETMS